MEYVDTETMNRFYYRSETVHRVDEKSQDQLKVCFGVLWCALVCFRCETGDQGDQGDQYRQRWVLKCDQALSNLACMYGSFT